MTVQDYIGNIEEERRYYFEKLRNVIINSLPKGFEEQMSYGMPGYVVPHSSYPKGYHCDNTLPLPFTSIASRKNSINFYHMGIYSIPELKDWFIKEYQVQFSKKLNMGKSCIRFNKFEYIPYDLIGELITKVNPEKWIKTYETLYIRK